MLRAAIEAREEVDRRIIGDAEEAAAIHPGGIDFLEAAAAGRDEGDLAVEGPARAGDGFHDRVGEAARHLTDVVQGRR